MADTLVFEKKSEQGSTGYQIHEAAGFAGHMEIAIVIEGTPIAIVSVDKSRSGVHIKTIESKKIFIANPKAAPEEVDTPPPHRPSVNDLAPRH
jgi:hypothetical protein